MKEKAPTVTGRKVRNGMLVPIKRMKNVDWNWEFLEEKVPVRRTDHIIGSPQAPIFLEKTIVKKKNIASEIKIVIIRVAIKSMQNNGILKILVKYMG